MLQLEHIETLEKRLWGAADTLRANSNYASAVTLATTGKRRGDQSSRHQGG